jgi:hypothetical protein
MPVILPPVPNAVQVAVTGNLNALPWANIFHLSHSAGALSSGTLDAVAASVGNAYSSHFLALMSTVSSVEQVKAMDLSSRTGPIGLDVTHRPGTGAGTAPAANSVAFCVSWSIVDRYRGGHPRTYIPGMLGTNIVNGHTWLDTFRLGMLGAASAFRTDLNAITAGGLTWQMVCVRYFSGHALLPDPAVRPIFAAVCRTRVDSMRRRTGKEAP